MNANEIKVGQVVKFLVTWDSRKNSGYQIGSEQAGRVNRVFKNGMVEVLVQDQTEGKYGTYETHRVPAKDIFK